MGQIQTFARMKIHDGKLDEYKRLAGECMESVRTKDSGTLQYEVYFNADETECMVFERYRDSEALLEHFKNLGPLFEAVLETCSGSGAVCGDVSAELRAAIGDSGVVGIYNPYLIM